MGRVETKKAQKKMIDERDRKLALKKGVTVKKLREDRLKSNREKGIAAATLLPFGGAAIKGGSMLAKGASKLKNVFKSKKPKATTTKKTTTTTTSPKSTGGVRFSRKKPATTTKTTTTTKKTPTTTTTKKTPLKTKAKKLFAATTGVGATKGRRSGLAIRDKKTGQLSGISKKTQKTGKNIRTGAKIAGAGTVGTLIASKAGTQDKKKMTAMPKPRPKNLKPTAPKKVTQNVAPKMKRTNITAGKNTGFGPKGNIFPSSDKNRKELMEKYGGTGSAAAKAAAQGTQGNMVTKAAGGLKPVPEGSKGKGLSKLPTEVRNKMGFMKKGGKLTKKKRYI